VKNIIIKFIAGALAACLPFIAALGIGLSAEPQFGNTFLGALADKHSRLEVIGKPKVVILGGSSVAFGLDSETLWLELDMPVVNFGLYATLGTKLMLDLARPSIKKDDIIVVAPELDAQTLSLYFNAESALQAFDSDMSMLRYTKFENYGALAGNFWDYAVSKLRYKRYGGLAPDGVYSKSSFNVDGDIIYPRPHNIMLLDYSPNHPINLDPSIVSEEFREYLNKFVKFAESKGASVYFDFPPMNRLGVVQYGDADAIYDFYVFLANALDCEIIGNINDYILDERYFYDSNYHLNDSGVLIRTALLAEDIKRAKNIGVPVAIELVPPPEKPADETVAGGDDVYSGYYLYEPYAGGLIITGVADAAKGMSELVVPRYADGKPVLAIGERAFAGCTLLTKVVIYDNIAQFYDRVFDGCERLETVIFGAVNAGAVAVGEDLFGGAGASCRIYLAHDAFGNFAVDYFWSRYSSRLDIFE